MSIHKKGRRKIVCGEKNYIWYVKQDYDSPYYLLHIVAEDKSLIVICPLKMNIPYILTYGGGSTFFQGEKLDGKGHRKLLPFAVPEIITPVFVAKLIDWAEHGEPTEEVQWDICNYPY